MAGAVTANNYLYSGEQFDPNVGFYYLRARYYNQENGRFLATDPWKGNDFEPVTLNKYFYANSNPVNFFDPSGRFSLIQTAQTIAIASVLASAAAYSLTALSHLIDKRNPVRWTGDLYVFTAGSTLGGGRIRVNLTSECRRKKRARGEYSLYLAGFTISDPRIIVGFSKSSIEMITPGLFGLDPKILTGHCLHISASFITRPDTGEYGGFHSTFGTLYMGFGYSPFEIKFGTAEWGFDIGIDVMEEASFGSNMIDNLPCP